jgi:threonine dehydratase
MDVAHNRAFGKLEVGGVELDLILETRGHDHIQQLLRVFHAEGITAQEVS